MIDPTLVIFGAFIVGSVVTLIAKWVVTAVKTKKIFVYRDQLVAVYTDKDDFRELLVFGHHRVSRKADLVHFTIQDGKVYVKYSYKTNIQTRDNRTVPLDVVATAMINDILSACKLTFGSTIPDELLQVILHDSFSSAGLEFSAAEIIAQRKRFLERVAEIHVEHEKQHATYYPSYVPTSIGLKEIKEPFQVTARSEIVDMSAIRVAKQPSKAKV